MVLFTNLRLWPRMKRKHEEGTPETGKKDLAFKLKKRKSFSELLLAASLSLAYIILLSLEWKFNKR